MDSPFECESFYFKNLSTKSQRTSSFYFEKGGKMPVTLKKVPFVPTPDANIWTLEIKCSFMNTIRAGRLIKFDLNRKESNL